MIKIGILGDIGSGKSYVANKFGYPVFNADLEVSKLYKKDKKIFNKLKKILPKYFNSFPINSVASSAIHHVSIKIWRTDQGYRLFIPRGFALSIWEILLETASQFGYEVL